MTQTFGKKKRHKLTLGPEHKKLDKSRYTKTHKTSELVFGSQNMLTAVDNFTKNHCGLDIHPARDTMNKSFL